MDEFLDAITEAFRPLADAFARIADALRYTPPAPRKKKPLIQNGRKPRK